MPKVLLVIVGIPLLGAGVAIGWFVARRGEAASGKPAVT
jgi:hypothetical protein